MYQVSQESFGHFLFAKEREPGAPRHMSDMKDADTRTCADSEEESYHPHTHTLDVAARSGCGINECRRP